MAAQAERRDRAILAAITGTRADYGMLQPVLALITKSRRFDLKVVATGMHLSPEFGLTYRAIEADGFAVADRVEMLLSSDTPVGIAKAIGLGTIGFAECFQRLQPDLLLIPGDRFEMLAAATAALPRRVPVAHLSGGDVTEGAIDEAIRHAITKMSHLHFVTNEPAARRLRQLGEDPGRIHLVGNPALDLIGRMDLMDRQAFEAAVGLKLRERNLLVTYHPVTLDDSPSAMGLSELLAALDALGPEVGLIFTKPNADTHGRVLIGMIDAFVQGHPNAVAHVSMGQRLYYSAMKHVSMVVGNSSSGLLEAPSFGIPTVNVGDRQRGRVRAGSVIDTPADAAAIGAAIRKAFTLDVSGVANPYGDGKSAERIVKVLRGLGDPRGLVRKHFHDLPVP